MKQILQPTHGKICVLQASLILGLAEFIKQIIDYIGTHLSAGYYKDVIFKFITLGLFSCQEVSTHMLSTSKRLLKKCVQYMSKL